MREHPHKLKHFVATLLIGLALMGSQLCRAEVINIPVKRAVATQPITTLEIIAIVKSLLHGRILSVRKQSSYSNPDCHLVKLLEDKGEFQLIKLGCFVDNNIVQVNK